MARGNPGAIALGPGILYIGPLGTAEPADLTTAWTTVDPAWAQLGYTADGSTFKYKLNTDTVEVAEELDPIKKASTSREASVAFALAELTATNLQRALAGGTITTGTGIVTYEPPDLGSEVRYMLGWQSEDATERWVFRQCFSDGEISIDRKKGADKATISTEFSLEKPTAARIFKAILAAPARA